MADRGLTGVVLVGGASRRFGSPKALARLGGRTLAERAWETLAFCDERLAVGKPADGLDLPFPVLDDATETRAPIAGVVAGLRAAAHERVLVLPVDVPLVGEAALRRLADACRDAAHPPGGPLPGAYRKSALPALEAALGSDDLSLTGALRGLDVALVEVDEAELANVNEPGELAALAAALAHGATATGHMWKGSGR